MSPSSGSTWWTYQTEDDWNTVQEIAAGGGGIGCCTISRLDAASPSAVFFLEMNQGFQEVHSLTTTNGNAVEHFYAVPGYPNAVEAIGDTTCIVAASENGVAFLLRATPNTNEVIDPIFPVPYGPVVLSFLDEDRGAMLIKSADGRNEIRFTSNGGYDWETTFVDTTHFVRDLAWGDPLSFWMVGDNGWVVGTTDGGTSWSTTIVPSAADLYAVAAYPMDSLWVGGSNGDVFVTGNGGSTWTDLSLPDTLVVDLWAFDGVVYAEAEDWTVIGTALRHLYKFTNENPESTSSGEWWGYSEEGIRLILAEGETLSELELLDAAGRAVRSTIVGQQLIMSGLSSGVYMLRIKGNVRTSIAKVLWQGLD